MNKLLCPLDVVGDMLNPNDIFSYLQFSLDITQSGSGTGKLTLAPTGLRANQITNILMDFTRDINGMIDNVEVSTKLGWNLGFAKTDTNFGTSQTAETFIRITDDYIYLTLNPELNMNTVDASAKEYLSQSQDTFGQSGAYFAKLLLNTFGSYCQTFVQAPKIFNPALGKLDKLHFTWMDKNGTIIDNADCEFTVVLQVTETVDVLDDSSTLDLGTKPLDLTIPKPPKRTRSRKLTKAERTALISKGTGF